MTEVKLCRIDNCGKPVKKGRICSMHSARKTRGGDFERRVEKLSFDELLGGQYRFGKWTVISEAEGVPRDGNGTIRRAHCQCDCGEARMVHVNALKRGTSRHCGCDVSALVAEMKTTHGKCRTAEYKAWAKLKERCLNPNSKDWPDYGGRGIKVCDTWINDPAAFLADMGLKPTPQHSIDRINVDGNYEPGNCRWADAFTQARNKRPRKRR